MDRADQDEPNLDPERVRDPADAEGSEEELDPEAVFEALELPDAEQLAADLADLEGLGAIGELGVPAEPAPPKVRPEANPRIAIVGRPNVGKSTLTNRLAGRRVSITEPTAGVTRDRVAVPATLEGYAGRRVVELLDTGGVGIVDRDDLGPHVEAQVRAAMATAKLVLFVVDAREGVTPLDQEVARRLRGFDVPVLLVANKAESERVAWEVESLRRLGVGEGPFAISAQNGDGVDDLVDLILERLPEALEGEGRVEPALKIAVVGRRNAGKSTLVNAFAGDERVIVSEIPGTTRDAVDVLIERDGEAYVVIDTAGVMKRKKMGDAVDFFSDARAHKAIQRADAVVLLFEAHLPLAGLDKRLARFVIDHHKPLILGANKWDLVPGGVTPDDFREYLDTELSGVRWAPVAFLSAKERKGVWQTLELARELHAAGGTRVGTGELNRVLELALKARVPSSKGYRVKVFYATQVGVHPPTFILFVNNKKLIDKGWLRFLENRLREAFDFDEVPIQVIVKERGRRSERPY